MKSRLRRTNIPITSVPMTERWNAFRVGLAISATYLNADQDVIPCKATATGRVNACASWAIMATSATSAFHFPDASTASATSASSVSATRGGTDSFAQNVSISTFLISLEKNNYSTTCWVGNAYCNVWRKTNMIRTIHKKSWYIAD